MKFIYPVLAVILAFHSGGARAEKEYVPTALDKFEWAWQDLEAFADHNSASALKHAVTKEGRRCIPDFEAKHDGKIFTYADEIVTAAQRTSYLASMDWSYNRANRPFIGALAGGQKSTKFMCDNGYEELISLYQDRIAHYTELHDEFLKHKELLAKNKDELEKLYGKKALIKEAASGKCFVLNDLFSAFKGLSGRMAWTIGDIDNLIPWAEGHIIGAAKELNSAREEQRATCVGKKVRAGVTQNPGYANEIEENPVVVPSAASSAE